ncbi:MAG: hypothetical protein P857_335 [Candidatus Xenolissoclinum pacificiensis L6]|uniref:Uncharacterized protein n=1 Tax=Candidatus Xenolissoclinum pacificiensis L6 TaxID=1401685 RepID=W2UZX9_9RICK|nr:MAG: hypothetical protein P857_335 [Candidatus Xenolissoclinum pacificiensis L6]
MNINILHQASQYNLIFINAINIIYISYKNINIYYCVNDFLYL